MTHLPLRVQSRRRATFGALLLIASLNPLRLAAQPDSAATSAGRDRGEPEHTAFAVELGVDLSTMRRLPSGVYIRDIEVGTGATAAPGREVTIRHIAYLADGTEVERSVAGESPVRFRVGARDVIRGWDAGLRGMRVGGTRLLVVPARLAYGARGKEKVPPNTVMVFVLVLDGVR